jgi:hypothetical protein
MCSKKVVLFIWMKIDFYLLFIQKVLQIKFLVVSLQH